MIVYRFQKVGKEIVLFGCDKDILGSKLKADNGVIVELRSSFFGNKTCNEKELVEMFNKATIVNLFGSRAVGAVKDQIDTILFIDGIPHIEMYRM